MKFNRQILASIFLILFGVIQLADLHIVSHDADDIDCSLCKFTSDNHKVSFTSPDTITIPDVILVPADVVRITYENRYFGSGIAHSFLNKAPPAA